MGHISNRRIFKNYIISNLYRSSHNTEKIIYSDNPYTWQGVIYNIGVQDFFHMSLTYDTSYSWESTYLESL